MPNYDYRCGECLGVEQHFHSFREEPEIACKECGAKMGKIFTKVSFSVKSHRALKQAMMDNSKKESEMRQELKEVHMVEQVSPIGAKNLAEVYREVKASGGSTKEQIQKTMEQNKKKMRAKQKEWQIGANRRVEKKTIESQNRKAAEEQAKRKITVTSKNS